MIGETEAPTCNWANIMLLLSGEGELEPASACLISTYSVSDLRGNISVQKAMLGGPAYDHIVEGVVPFLYSSDRMAVAPIGHCLSLEESSEEFRFIHFIKLRFFKYFFIFSFFFLPSSPPPKWGNLLVLSHLVVMVI